jgi:hypothetical protein
MEAVDHTETEHVVEEVLDDDYYSISELSDLFFSNCGKYMVAKASTLDFPLITPIAGTLLPKSLCLIEATKEAPDIAQEVKQQGALSIYIPGFISKTETQQMEITATGATTGFQTSLSRDRVSLQFWQEDSSISTSKDFELVKVPDWDGVEHTTASIQFPKTKEDNFRVVLNQPIRSWNTLPDNEIECFPLVISRDPSCVKPRGVQRNSGAKASSIGWVNMPRLGEE